MHDWFNDYKQLLEHTHKYNNDNDKQNIVDAYINDISKSNALQNDSMLNGRPCPIVAYRKDMKTVKIIVTPQQMVNVGDLIYVFKHYWICVELYEDEYGMLYGCLWLCNHIIKYQNKQGKVIEKHAVLDNGSYANNSNQPLHAIQNKFNCYVSCDVDTQGLYVDKRLAMGITYDAMQNKILDVCKIGWIDNHTMNNHNGSHLMLIGLDDDVYDSHSDNIDVMICDYIDTPTNIPVNTKIIIDGSKSIPVGASRTYVASSAFSNVALKSVNWEITDIDPAYENMVNIENNNDNTCIIEIKEDYSLVGLTFMLNCTEALNPYLKGSIELEVR